MAKIIAQDRSEKNHAEQKRQKLKSVTIPDFFKNNLIKQYRIKNADYIRRFKNIEPIIQNAERNFDETNEIIKQIKQSPYNNVVPFDINEYNNFWNDFQNVRSNFYNQKRGAEGEERVRNDLQSYIGNNFHSNLYCKILYDVSVPFKYNHKNSNTNQSIQIDVLLICNYGIYALEVKNYNADQISILGKQNNEDQQIYDYVSSEKYKVPVAYIEEINKNTRNKSMDGFNSISHQTYIHKKALVNFLQDQDALGISYEKANSIVYSPMIYANKDIDKYGYKTNTQEKEKFYLGNKVSPKVQNDQNTWEVIALPYKGIFDWIINSDTSNPNALSKNQIQRIDNLLYKHVGVKYEKLYDMTILDTPEDFNNFIKQWNEYNKKVKDIIM